MYSEAVFNTKVNFPPRIFELSKPSQYRVPPWYLQMIGIPKFPLHKNNWFKFAKPQNALCFFLRCQHDRLFKISNPINRLFTLRVNIVWSYYVIYVSMNLIELFRFCHNSYSMINYCIFLKLDKKLEVFFFNLMYYTIYFRQLKVYFFNVTFGSLLYGHPV